MCYVKKPEGAVGAGETEEGEKLAALQIRIGIKEVDWNKGLNSFDCHVGAVPQSNYSGAELKQHPAQKPVSVYEWLIAATTQPGELVCDPFCGSGTAGIAALRLKRRFQGIETDPHYLELAQRRIAAYGTSGAGVETEAEVAPTPFALEPDLEEPEPGELELDLEARGSAATTHQTSLS